MTAGKELLLLNAHFTTSKLGYGMSVTDDNACLLVAAKLQKSLRKELNIVGAL